MAQNVYELLTQAWAVAKTSDANIYGVEVAIVTNVKDPEQRGRVKICFPRLPGKPESDWARVAQPAAGPGRGFYWVPDVNDEVLVAFERGQSSRPFVIGALWNGKDRPMKDAFTDDNTRQMIQSRSGHQLIFDDKGGAEKIVLADKSGKRSLTFDVKEKKLLVEAMLGDVEIHASKKMVLQCETLEIKTGKTGKLDIGLTFDLKVAQKASLSAGPKMELKAQEVNLNPPSLNIEALITAAERAAAAAVAAAAAAAAAKLKAAAGQAPGGGPLGPSTVPSSDVLDGGQGARAVGRGSQGGDRGQKGGAAPPGGTAWTEANPGGGAVQGGGGAAPQGGRAPPQGQQQVGTDWIELNVADDQGQPMGGLRYVLTDAAGNAASGTLDAQGHARIEHLPSGPASLSFPDLDPAEVTKQQRQAGQGGAGGSG